MRSLRERLDDFKESQSKDPGDCRMKKLPEAKQVEFLRSLLEHNVKAIVEYEDLVRIECDVMPMRVVFSVFVANSDVGLVLGREGVIADCIRAITWIASKKTHRKVDIDIITSGRT